MTSTGQTASFEGGCLCERLRYRIERRFLNAMHCHCEMCRKAHGTAYSTHIVVRPDQLVWTKEDAALKAFESSPRAYREFCSGCGTHLLVHGQSGDGNLAIPAGTLDGAPELTILGHMFVEAKVPWLEITDEHPRFERWPPGFGPEESSGS